MSIKRLAGITLSTLLLVSCASGTPNTSESTSLSTPQSAVSQSASQEGYPVTIETFDYAGNPVQTTYEKAPEKVVAMERKKEADSIAKIEAAKASLKVLKG